MIPILVDERAILLHGDASKIASMIAPESIDAIVTDPPAGIALMGKAWDTDKGGRDAWIAWLRDIMREAFKVLKPGGHALVWALPRTSHWTMTAIEDAGFEIRDVGIHLFGTGFPKSLNVGEGRGTALKPAAEHWILARKPLDGTVAANVLAHGTGALNIEACRIETTDDLNGGAYSGTRRPAESPTAFVGRGIGEHVAPSGRWPAHVTLDEEAAAALDAQSGGASRFFYVAKGSPSEKDAGLDHLPERNAAELTDREEGSAGLNSPRAGASATARRRNFHPTVKSVALMRWLVRLITPPGGVVLDLFAGSGTTGVAALAEGASFVGVELTDEYLPILEGRIRHALKGTP